MAAFYRCVSEKFRDTGAWEGGYLSAVDELSQGDVSVVAEDVDILEMGIGSVLEFDAEEVTNIRGRATAELNSDSGRVLGCGGLTIINRLRVVQVGCFTYGYP